MQTKRIEILVGIFMFITLFSVIFFCFKVLNIGSIQGTKTYQISAFFDDVGGLKVNSPVRIGGVIVGRIKNITLDSKTYIPKVIIDINKNYNHIPSTSSLIIRTSGLLGEQYLAFNIGFIDSKMSTSVLKEGDVIYDTQSAVILEDLIGRFFYSKER